MSQPNQPQDPSALPAGRDLDALVAEQVMGWRCLGQWTGEGPPDNSDWVGVPPGQVHAECLPYYSTDIAAAWKVLDRMRQRFSNVTVTAANGWTAVFWDIGPRGESANVTGANGDTAPLAICRAALQAVGAG